ncbi:unnamed protein product [Paramecium octaurelia]|uniref:WD-40 repeat protein n=1 Tax=Paramecium octaurelia TaxID=43137 RepID=A0A8S1V731_PAROT|nr:unnamed protein product [Paramecium octaurelia]
MTDCLMDEKANVCPERPQKNSYLLNDGGHEGPIMTNPKADVTKQNQRKYFQIFFKYQREFKCFRTKNYDYGYCSIFFSFDNKAIHPQSLFFLTTINSKIHQTFRIIYLCRYQQKHKTQYKQQKINLNQKKKKKKMNCINKKGKCLFWFIESLKDIDVEILSLIIQILQKEKVSDSLGFLQKFSYQEHYNEYNFEFENCQTFEKWWRIDAVKNSMKMNTNILLKLTKCDFFLNNYSYPIYQEIRNALIVKISKEQKIIKFLIFLVHLTSIDDRFIQCGSNSLYLLVQLKVNLTNKNFQNIKIKHTNLIGAELMRCNLSGSEFENVDITDINLNGAILINCRWKNLRINKPSYLSGHAEQVNSVCFSPDCASLASCSNDNSICLWDLKKRKIRSRLQGRSMSKRVCFANKSTTLASCNGNFVDLWNLQTGKKISKLTGHSKNIQQICFSSNYELLAYGDEDSTIYLWDVKRGKLNSKLDGQINHLQSICFSPDSTMLGAGGGGLFQKGKNSLRLWDLRTGEQKANLDGHYSVVYTVCFSPDGITLAFGCRNNSIHLWDVKTGQYKAKLDGHSNEVNSICYSPDGTTLASGSGDKSIRLWNVKTGQQVAKFQGHASGVLSVCFSPDGTKLASGSEDLTIRLWDISKEQQKAKSDGHLYAVQSICFSPDGAILASTNNDQYIYLWDVKTGCQKAQLVGHSNIVRSVYFSPDGMTLASCSDDNSIRLWNVQTGQQKTKLDGHKRFVQSLSISSDGITLASGSGDQTVRLWDISTGQEKAKLEGHKYVVEYVCFSPDGTTLASGGYDGSFLLWNVKTGQQILPSYQRYNSLLSQLKAPLEMMAQKQNIINNNKILRISKNPGFQVQGALILKGEFLNYLGVNLLSLFKSKGSCILKSKI